MLTSALTRAITGASLEDPTRDPTTEVGLYEASGGGEMTAEAEGVEGFVGAKELRCPDTWSGLTSVDTEGAKEVGAG